MHFFKLVLFLKIYATQNRNMKLPRLGDPLAPYYLALRSAFMLLMIFFLNSYFILPQEKIWWSSMNDVTEILTDFDTPHHA